MPMPVRRESDRSKLGDASWAPYDAGAEDSWIVMAHVVMAHVVMALYSYGLHRYDADAEDSVRVLVRVRPLHPKETMAGATMAVEMPDDSQVFFFPLDASEHADGERRRPAPSHPRPLRRCPPTRPSPLGVRRRHAPKRGAKK